MVPKEIRTLAKYGAWGIHASLLPKYAGGAPLVWAIINGEKVAGVTFFKFEDGVDDGDIIAQKSFPIKYEDSIKEVYEKASEASKKILIESLQNIDQIKFKPQDKSKIEVYLQRRPSDGEIDLNKTAIEIQNFIRAQSKPYPGAFSTINGKTIIFWEVKFSEKNFKNKKNDEVVKCRDKAYINLEDGVLEVQEVTFNGRRDEFYNIVRDENLWGEGLGAKGITLGKGSIIGANSLVNKEVPER